MLAALLEDPETRWRPLMKNLCRQLYPVTGELIGDFLTLQEDLVTERNASLPLYEGIPVAMKIYLPAKEFVKFHDELLQRLPDTRGQERADVEKLAKTMMYTRLELKRIEGDTFDCGALEELPTKVVIPKRKTVLSDLPNSYEIRYRFDADKDGELSDSEMFKLLIELHYILQKANSSYEREMLIERYANAITSQENANEFSITWGKNSAFRIAKDKDGRWSAPDEEPVKRHKIGTHPSQTKFRERLGDKKFRAYAMKILSRTNPFLRAEKIEELLNCDAKDYESAAESLAKSPIFSGFYEYINEKSELVLIPLFKTDPAETINALNKFSDENISRFTKDEAREYKNFIQEKTRREEVLF